MKVKIFKENDKSKFDKVINEYLEDVMTDTNPENVEIIYTVSPSVVYVKEGIPVENERFSYNAMVIVR